MRVTNEEYYVPLDANYVRIPVEDVYPNGKRKLPHYYESRIDCVIEGIDYHAVDHIMHMSVDYMTFDRYSHQEYVKEKLRNGILNEVAKRLWKDWK